MFNHKTSLNWAVAAVVFSALLAIPAVQSQPFNPGVSIFGSVTIGNCAAFGPGAGQIQDGGGCPALVPSALTQTNDTNVTLTLGGTPLTALLQPTSLTLGWTGTLAAARLNANVVQGITNDTNVTGAISAQQLTLGWTGTVAAGRLNSNVVQSIVNDTNLTGSISAQALTLAWSGTLAAGRLNSNVVQAITNDTNVTGSITAQNLSLGWTGTLGFSRMQNIATSTVYGNFIGSTGAPTAAAVPSCANDGGHALTNNAGGGFNCAAIASGGTVTSITAGPLLSTTASGNAGTITTAGTIYAPALGGFAQAAYGGTL